MDGWIYIKNAFHPDPSHQRLCRTEYVKHGSAKRAENPFLTAAYRTTSRVLGFGGAPGAAASLSLCQPTAWGRTRVPGRIGSETPGLGLLRRPLLAGFPSQGRWLTQTSISDSNTLRGRVFSCRKPTPDHRNRCSCNSAHFAGSCTQTTTLVTPVQLKTGQGA